ncbi:hypothetical protein RUM4293_01487 [Ruegeria atlantica]|uniref:Uncharacterized protein n=1 Tax=Ruegeria atlantica TaxID=81569 RepID=A0A0P1EJM4_9RHOB|nr:hypothetical protein RUM4293_01487 [Ruegeria atlantica]
MFAATASGSFVRKADMHRDFGNVCLEPNADVPKTLERGRANVLRILKFRKSICDDFDWNPG